ncbi:MAG: hypothetical protein OXG05_06270 [Gammaproteobacteria bacterium]|nr:hypothetical protein [Gammaproteobacteria bacterium]
MTISDDGEPSPTEIELRRFDKFIAYVKMNQLMHPALSEFLRMVIEDVEQLPIPAIFGLAKRADLVKYLTALRNAIDAQAAIDQRTLDEVAPDQPET